MGKNRTIVKGATKEQGEQQLQRSKERKELSREDLPLIIGVPSLARFKVNFQCNFLNSLF
jgi:hypothetical protein